MMKKNLTIALAVFVVVVLFGCSMWAITIHDARVRKLHATPVLKIMSPKDATYIIHGTAYTLVNGLFERVIAPHSVTKEQVFIFGEPTYGDLDGDGDLDAAMFLAYESGGSATFYYVAVALNEGGSYVGTDALFLGDRVAIQTIEIHNGRAVANIVERKAGEPFTTPPSMGRSVYVHVDPKTHEIGELVQNFEGESAVPR